MLRVTGRFELSRVPEGKIAVNQYDGNPGKIDFGLSYRDVRVSEGSSYRESTVYLNCGRTATKRSCKESRKKNRPHSSLVVSQAFLD